MGRVLALDYGSRTVGVAVSDPLGVTAQSVETITRDRENALRRTFSRIEELVELYHPEYIVVGLPLHMNGEAGIRAQKSVEFAQKLSMRTGIETVMWDERLTTEAAIEVMDECGVSIKDRKKYSDKIAAAVILEDHMGSDEYKKRHAKGV